MPRIIKLVRDKVTAKMDQEGTPYTKIPAGEEMKKDFLFKKLYEETLEFLTAIPDGKPEKILEELADLDTVLDKIKKLSEFKYLESVKAKKTEEEGAFEEGIIIEFEK